MGKIDRQKTALAAQHVARSSNTVITEVIEKDEDQHLTFTDRCAAVAAAVIVCGLMYFVMWFGILFQLARVDIQTTPQSWVWIWSWRTPCVATVLTGVLAFMRPGMAYRYFGKVAKAFGYFLLYWS